MGRTIVVTCVAWLRRGLQKSLRGIGGGGGGGGGERSGFLTTFVSIIVFFVFYFSFSSYNRGYVERMAEDGTVANALIEGDQPNRTWMDLRKLLLERNGNMAKVVVFSYMRGGSTLFSEIFNQNNATDVLWYEPMDAFYQSYAGLEAHSIPLTILYYMNNTRRILDDSEKNEITNYLENLLSCRPENLPIETLGHFYISYSSAFQPVHSCMEAKKTKAMILDCKKPLRPICGYTDLVRRNMSVTFANKCPQLIAAFKSLKNMGRFLVQRLLIDPSKSDTAATRDIVAASQSRSGVGKKANLTDSAIAKLKGGNVSDEETRNKQLLAEHALCLSQLRPTLKECVLSAVGVCRRAMLTTLKLVRTMLEDLEATIQRIPDVHVIYYVRDPRAIATSRAEERTGLTMQANVRTAVVESKILCQKMMEDIKAKRLLETKYPGSVVTVRYEDFVRSPLSHVREIFKTIGRPVPRNINEWIRSKFNGTKDNGIYGTVRVNPVSTSLNWMSQVSLRDALQMEEHCLDVLREFGYTTLREMNASGESNEKATSLSTLLMTTNKIQNDEQSNVVSKRKSNLKR